MGVANRSETWRLTRLRWCQTWGFKTSAHKPVGGVTETTYLLHFTLDFLKVSGLRWKFHIGCEQQNTSALSISHQQVEVSMALSWHAPLPDSWKWWELQVWGSVLAEPITCMFHISPLILYSGGQEWKERLTQLEPLHSLKEATEILL